MEPSLEYDEINYNDLKHRVKMLAQKIVEDIPEGEIPLMVCVLKGAFVFFADLTRDMGDVMIETEFMSVSSYGDEQTSSGVVEITQDIGVNIAGRHVILVEDIVDTGLTLNYLRDILLRREPASLRICVLLDKVAAREVEVPIDYIGFEIENVFVVGYGLDYAGHYRNHPWISVLKESAYKDTESE
ncbi:hypoxanthine phosphoribosyltransferase [Candidatus Parcubacteria bacterium]|nr:hypoxanthine phosphoribosyltransferase [Candidatus Parcubacteria bacterium]MBT7228843.1 hypoxanthine phosphoribosyltransferase [Candidatus Parcubacteria bacterium]